MRFIVLLLTTALFFLSGCDGTAYRQVSSEADQLRLENSDLKYQLESCQQQNKQLTDQFETLSRLDPNRRLESLYQLNNVSIGSFTNLYDKNEDGKVETLIVYIQPIDKTGDSVKAAGEINIQLWDLGEEPKEAQIGEWNVSAAELKKLWYGSLLSGNYRLTFDVGEKIKNYDSPLTVKMLFTDYISGKAFRAQKTIKPQQ